MCHSKRWWRHRETMTMVGIYVTTFCGYFGVRISFYGYSGYHIGICIEIFSMSHFGNEVCSIPASVWKTNQILILFEHFFFIFYLEAIQVISIVSKIDYSSLNYNEQFQNI